jgi:hypothetical protein
MHHREVEGERTRAGLLTLVYQPDQGDVYTWGNGGSGQLGHGGSDNEFEPNLVEHLLGKTAISIACGWWTTTAITRAEADNPLALVVNTSAVPKSNRPAIDPSTFSNVWHAFDTRALSLSLSRCLSWTNTNA